MTDVTVSGEQLLQDWQERARTERAGHIFHPLAGGRTQLVAFHRGIRQGGDSQPAIAIQQPAAGPAPTAAPYAISVTTGVQSFAAAGTVTEWTGEVSGPATVGFALTFPTATLVIVKPGTYRLDLGHKWDDYGGGGTVEVLVNGATVWGPDSATYGAEFQDTYNLGLLATGDEVQVRIGPTAGTEDGTTVGSLVLVEPAVSAGVPVGVYSFAIFPENDTVSLGRFVHGAGQEIVATASFPSSDFTWYGLRARIDGGRIRARAWLWDNSEPSTWAIDWTDPAPLAPGYAGFGGAIGSPTLPEGRFVDYIEVSQDGAAPLTTDFSEYPLSQKPSDWIEVAGQIDSQWRIESTVDGIGGKLARYNGDDVGSKIGWQAPGRGSTTEVLARVLTKDPGNSVSVALRGTPLSEA